MVSGSATNLDELVGRYGGLQAQQTNSPEHRSGYSDGTVRPERAKALHHVLGLLPLQGVDSPIEPIPQGVALG